MLSLKKKKLKGNKLYFVDLFFTEVQGVAILKILSLYCRNQADEKCTDEKCTDGVGSQASHCCRKEIQLWMGEVSEESLPCDAGLKLEVSV